MLPLNHDGNAFFCFRGSYIAFACVAQVAQPRSLAGTGENVSITIN